jgi:hypothetical protein
LRVRFEEDSFDRLHGGGRRAEPMLCSEKLCMVDYGRELWELWALDLKRMVVQVFQGGRLVRELDWW